MQRVFFILTYFLICTDSSAQQYPFVHYTPKDGLVNSRVRKAYQDSKGRIYFLTYGGLSVFNGARFSNFTTQQGLANNLVNDILEVGNDSLLVATNSGYYLNTLVKGKMKKLNTGRSTLPIINRFYRSEKGDIYLSSDNGLFLLEQEKIIELNVSAIPVNKQSFPYLGEITGSGNFLVISTNDLKANKGLFLYDIQHNSICDALPDIGIHLLGKDRDDNIWASSFGKLLVLDKGAFQKGKLSLMPPQQHYLRQNYFSSVNFAFDNEGIWFAYRNKDSRNEEIHRIEVSGSILKIPMPEQATRSDIRSIFIDKENNIWICNDGEAVFKIVRSPLHIFPSPLEREIQGQTDNAYYYKGVTWFNTNNYKLFKKSGEHTKEYTCNIQQVPMVFYQDKGIMLAADNKNVYEAAFRDQPNINFRKIISLSDTESFGNTHMLDNGETILSSQRKHISIWKNNVPVYSLTMDNDEGVEKIFFDKHNLVWFAKRHTGIDVYRMHPGNIAQYLEPVYSFSREQINGSIRSIVIDKKGLVWVGTRENGITAYQQSSSRLKPVYHFDISNGLNDNFVTSLACDSLNNIIAGTQSGLDRIICEKNLYRIENLTKNNNFFAYIKKVWVDEQNLAYALTNAGIILQVAPPTAQSAKKFSPVLLLEDIKVNGQSVPAGKTPFTYLENNLNFIVAAPSFIDEKQISFTYLLEGSGNRNWSDTSYANSTINLTNLSPGNYLLKVKAFFPSSIYPSVELNHSFEITPPWWQTWWFWLTMGIFGIGVLVGIIRLYYNRRMEKKMAILEKHQAIEKERTRIATDMHDDLGAGLSRIKFLSQSLAHKDAANQSNKDALEKITGYSDEMIEKMGEIVWALNQKNDTLADLVAYTRSYAVEYLANHHIECNADTPLNLPATFIPGELRRNIFLSVKECLHNVVKHANASVVNFSIGINDCIQIVIHDNGKGIDWNRMRQYGNGLLNIERRMTEINGKAEFINDQGTRVLLLVPLNL